MDSYAGTSCGPPTEFLSDCQLGELVVGEEKSGVEFIFLKVSEVTLLKRDMAKQAEADSPLDGFCKHHHSDNPCFRPKFLAEV